MKIHDFLINLGLEPGKNHTPAEVKAAWRKACNEHHPDKEGGDKEKFLIVMHSYKMLTDPSYRREEDDRASDKRFDLTIRMQIPVTFEDMFFGRNVKVSYNRIEKNDDGSPVIKEEQEIVTLNLICPIGIQSAEKVIQGKGLKKGDQVGDVVVRFVPSAHPKYSLDGPNVVAREGIELDTCLKGGEIEVQTLYGLKTVLVPPATKPDDRLIIKNCGVLQKGDHMIIVDVIYPSKEDLKSKDAWKVLDIDWATHEKKDEVDADFERAFIGLGGNPFIIRGFSG